MSMNAQEAADYVAKERRAGNTEKLTFVIKEGTDLAEIDRLVAKKGITGGRSVTPTPQSSGADLSRYTKALGDPPKDGSDEMVKFERELFADPLVVKAIDGLEPYQREFLIKAKAAQRSSGVSVHVKLAMKDQAERMIALVNNGGAVVPDFDSLGQIGSTGTIQKNAHPATLVQKINAAYAVASQADWHILDTCAEQAASLQTAIDTQENKLRVAKSEPCIYDAQNAATAEMITRTIEQVTARGSGINPHGVSSEDQVRSLGSHRDLGGAAGGPGNKGDVAGAQGKTEPEPVAHVTGQHADPGSPGDFPGELVQAEKELAAATDVLAKQRLGERVTYLKLLKMHGG